MQIDKELYKKFPAVLKDKLMDGEIEFPSITEFEYERKYVYRAVERKKNDNHKVTIEDFKSYFELGKTPKKARGSIEYWKKKAEYYGVSSFLKKEIVEQQMHFPNPNKKMAEGYVFCEGGPQCTNINKQHVCWWLYEGADVSNFKIVEEEKND